MFLKNIVIKDKNGFLIRKVEFKKGVNIIKGVEVESTSLSSTNSIGKTTLLRCIDFCLAGQWNQFIFDKEFRSVKNNTVFDFFKNTLPIFELSIVSNMDDEISASWILTRSLKINTKSKKDMTTFSVENSINGNKVSDDQYKSEIKNILFDLTFAKPTLRQLIPKFIRTSDHQISSVINYLNPMTSNSDYELLHLFLFDFKDIKIINDKISKEIEAKNKYIEVNSLKDLVGVGTEEINDVKRNELEEQQRLYNNFKIDEDYSHENDLLNNEQERLNYIKANISNIYLDIDVWQRRLEELKRNSTKIDSESIHYMYEEAEIYNVELRKKYDETIAFHQSMIVNEINFISDSIEKSNEQLRYLEGEYKSTALTYSNLLEDLGNKGSLADFTNIGNRITELTKEIAENEALINRYEKSRHELSSLREDFESTVKEVDDLISGDFRRKLAVFNRYFLEYSKDLSDNGYILATSLDRNHHVNLIPMSQNKDGHVGDGRKQTLVIAFDLAYVSFAKDPSIDIKRPSFFTQDKVEIVDKTMLNQLIDLINSTESQFIFPVISEKLEGLADFDENNVILCLSENNKFFDIENYEARKSLVRIDTLYVDVPQVTLRKYDLSNKVFTSPTSKVA